MISLIFTRKKLLVGISGKVTEFIDLKGSPFIEYGNRTPAQTLKDSLEAILNEYNYYATRNGWDNTSDINVNILFPNEEPSSHLLEIQKIISEAEPNMTIVHVDNLVLPYLYGTSAYDEVIVEPCLAVEALDDYISILYFYHPKQEFDHFIHLREQEFPLEFLRKKLSNQRLDSLGIRQVFLLGKYLYGEEGSNILEQKLMLNGKLVKKNPGILTPYKIMIKGCHRKMESQNFDPLTKIIDWDSSQKQILLPQVPDVKLQEAHEVAELMEYGQQIIGPREKPINLSLNIDNRSVEVNHYAGQEEGEGPNIISPNATASPGLEALKSRLDDQTELFQRMFQAFEESNKRANESYLRSREAEEEVERLKKALSEQQEEFSKRQVQSEEVSDMKEDIHSKEAKIKQLQEQVESLTLNLEKKEAEVRDQQHTTILEEEEVNLKLKNILLKQEKELAQLQLRLEGFEMVKQKLHSRNQEIHELKTDLVLAQEELGKVHDELVLTKEDLGIAKNDLIGIQKDLATAQEELARSGFYRESVQTQQAEIASLKQQLDTLLPKQEEWKKKEEEWEKLQTQLKDYARLTEEIKQHKEEITSLNKVVKSERKEVSSLQEKLKHHSKLEQSLKSKEKEVNKLKKTIELRKQDIANLKVQLRTFNRVKKTLKNILD